MLARPGRRASYHRALRSGELIPHNERELRRSEGSGTITELWGRRNLDAQKGAACSYVTLWLRGAVLALPTASSGERRTHSSE